MCSGPTVRSPTPQQPKEKPPVYMRNRYLDGLGMGAEAGGRNSLRIDMGSPAARRPVTASAAAPMPASGVNPALAMGVTASALAPGGRVYGAKMGMMS